MQQIKLLIDNQMQIYVAVESISVTIHNLLLSEIFCHVYAKFLQRIANLGYWNVDTGGI